MKKVLDKSYRKLKSRVNNEKIMIVNTIIGSFGESEKPTGLWLRELVHFYDYFSNENYELVK